MQDDKNTLDDDFDDLDFEDLGEDDDFDDESWDDFDDGDAGQPDGDAQPSESMTDAESSAPVKKKSFLQKNFNLIVISIALLGGGGFIFSQLGGGTPAPAPQQDSESVVSQDVNQPDTGNENAISAPTEIAGLNDESMPPMPAPIENAGTDIALSDTPDLNFELEDTALTETAEPMDAGLDIGLETDAQNTDDVLTPIPDLSDSGDLEPLESLDLAVNEEIVPAIEDTLPEVTEADIPAAIEDIPDVSLNEENNEAEDLQVIVDSPENMAEETLSEEIVEMPAAQETSEEQKAMVEDLNAQIEAKEQALADARQENQGISEQLEAANDEIISLKSMVDTLKNEVEGLKAAAAETKKDETPAETVPEKEEEQPVTNQPIEKQDKKVETAAPKAEPSVQWVLRSASPGQATISPKDNNDLRQIEVGDNVPGLGKVESIAIENNRWIVRGSKGTVSQ